MGSSIPLRAAAPALLAAALAAAGLAVAPGPAGAESAEPEGAGGTTVDVVRIREVRGALRFVAPATVHEGDELEIVNETDPRKVGPHTFSLVRPGSLPRTRGARQRCDAGGHICRAIARWHGAEGDGPPTVNPVEAGPEGWSTMGNLHRRGDSWFSGFRRSASFAQPVTVDATAGPQTIYFLCAIHPWMHGRIEVLPPQG